MSRTSARPMSSSDWDMGKISKTNKRIIGQGGPLSNAIHISFGKDEARLHLLNLQ